MKRALRTYTIPPTLLRLPRVCPQLCPIWRCKNAQGSLLQGATGSCSKPRTGCGSLRPKEHTVAHWRKLLAPSFLRRARHTPSHCAQVLTGMAAWRRQTPAWHRCFCPIAHRTRRSSSCCGPSPAVSTTAPCGSQLLQLKIEETQVPRLLVDSLPVHFNAFLLPLWTSRQATPARDLSKQTARPNCMFVADSIDLLAPCSLFALDLCTSWVVDFRAAPTTHHPRKQSLAAASLLLGSLWLRRAAIPSPKSSRPAVALSRASSLVHLSSPGRVKPRQLLKVVAIAGKAAVPNNDTCVRDVFAIAIQCLASEGSRCPEAEGQFRGRRGTLQISKLLLSSVANYDPRTTGCCKVKNCESLLAVEMRLLKRTPWGILRGLLPQVASRPEIRQPVARPCLPATRRTCSGQAECLCTAPQLAGCDSVL
ncbi:unnamed protein product [Polarella glacialis]|uniref:Uncharacterized protein n=1 Tax=Polarella glacialis TaxID=89957 RepID=A0A813FJ49_POLGL|nr:unnamed protein product [Polarella glacialis]